MKSIVRQEDVSIRNELRPGDIGMIVQLHGTLYQREYGYGVAFESYVAAGLSEFFEMYEPSRSRIWICEHNNNIVGSIVLVDRGTYAQLRYFFLLPEYRGIGLGTKLMQLFVEFLKKCKYRRCYLWTTDELVAAAHLYQKFGFTITEEKNSSTFGKPVTEQKYELQVI